VNLAEVVGLELDVAARHLKRRMGRGSSEDGTRLLGSLGKRREGVPERLEGRPDSLGAESFAEALGDAQGVTLLDLVATPCKAESRKRAYRPSGAGTDACTSEGRRTQPGLFRPCPLGRLEPDDQGARARLSSCSPLFSEL
jgi:hypothetical protein